MTNTLFIRPLSSRRHVASFFGARQSPAHRRLTSGGKRFPPFRRSQLKAAGVTAILPVRRIADVKAHVQPG
jgi:hypothetical protein